MYNPIWQGIFILLHQKKMKLNQQQVDALAKTIFDMKYWDEYQNEIKKQAAEKMKLLKKTPLYKELSKIDSSLVIAVRLSAGTLSPYWLGKKSYFCGDNIYIDLRKLDDELMSFIQNSWQMNSWDKELEIKNKIYLASIDGDSRDWIVKAVIDML